MFPTFVFRNVRLSSRIAQLVEEAHLKVAVVFNRMAQRIVVLPTLRISQLTKESVLRITQLSFRIAQPVKEVHFRMFLLSFSESPSLQWLC